VPERGCDLVQSHFFAEMVEPTICRYRNRTIKAALMIAG
jgi:hypothetical protein